VMATTSYLAARFWRFRSQSASCRHVYVASASRYSISKSYITVVDYW